MGSSQFKILIIIALLSGVILFIGWLSAPEEEALEDDQCEYVVKTSEFPAHISEPTAGEYLYQVIASSDGYITILKCQ